MKKQIIFALSLALILSSCQSESNDKSIDDKLKSNDYSQMTDKSDDFSNSNKKEGSKTPIEDRLIVKDKKNHEDNKDVDKKVKQNNNKETSENTENVKEENNENAQSKDDYTLISKDGVYGIALQGPDSRDFGYLESFEIKDGYLYTNASFNYNEEDTGSFTNDLTEFNKYKFKLADDVKFSAKGGTADPYYMTSDEFTSYLNECMGTGLAFIVNVSNSEVFELTISS